METSYNFLPKTEEEYLQARVLDQIEWYEKKSAYNKKWFQGLKVVEIVLSLCIPFLAAYITDSNNRLKIIVGVLAIIVAAIASIITLIKFQENWVEYRALAESIKLEKFLFLSKAGPYKGVAEPFPLFVERFEDLIATSTKKWVSYVSKNEGENKQVAGQEV